MYYEGFRWKWDWSNKRGPLWESNIEPENFKIEYDLSRQEMREVGMVHSKNQESREWENRNHALGGYGESL